jgi:hypothetical protein
MSPWKTLAQPIERRRARLTKSSPAAGRRHAARPKTLMIGGTRCRACSDIDENLIAHQHARPAVVQPHLERFRRHEIPCSHDQFRAARLVLLQSQGDHAFNHVALALTDFGHIDRDGTRHRAEACGVMHQVGDFRAPEPCVPDFAAVPMATRRARGRPRVSGFKSSNPLWAARQSGLRGDISRCVRTRDIPAGYAGGS